MPPVRRGLAGERRRTRPGRPADAWARLGGHDPGPARGPVRRRLDEVAERLDRLRATTCGRVADFLRTERPQPGPEEQDRTANPQARGPLERVETRGIEPLTPALQRRCSAN